MPASTSPGTDVRPSFWGRFWRGFRRWRQQPDWELFAGEDWRDRIMTEEVVDRYHAKQGRAIGRWTLTAPDGRQLVVYLKRHFKLPLLNGLLAAILPSRAWSPGLQEWEHLEWAALQGVPVPRAVAAGEMLGPGAKLQSFLATEELTGMLPLHEAIPAAQRHLDPLLFVKWKRSLARELARLARMLHDRSAYHKDLYLCHFYVHADNTRRLPPDWRNQVVVIDLHRLARHRLIWSWWLVKDLAQLLYSSEISGVTHRDRLAFWQAYRRGKKRTLLGWLIRLKWKLYRKHNRKRKGNTQLIG